jgi:hypothetical protein
MPIAMKDKADESPKPEEPTLSEKLFGAFLTFYSPGDITTGFDEVKSTRELLEEMHQIDEVNPWEINKLMEAAGFKLHYTGSGYGWLLKINDQ